MEPDRKALTKMYKKRLKQQRALNKMYLILVIRTKSCWLTWEAITFASWITPGGSAVISAAFKPRKWNWSFAIIFKANFNRSVVGFHHLCTIVPFRASSAQQMCIHHLLCTGVRTARVLNLHVLVLHVRVERLQLTQLQEVRGKQSERLHAAEKINARSRLKQERAYGIFVFALLLLCWPKRCFTTN